MRTSRLLIALFLGVTSTCFAQAPTWTGIGPGGGIVNTLAIDPATPTTLYAGTQGSGVFKTTDGGASWSAINNGLTNLLVFALAIDPATPTTLYAGTFAVGGGGVFKSTDGGASWSLLNTGVFGRDRRALAIDPGTPTTIYAGAILPAH